MYLFRFIGLKAYLADSDSFFIFRFSLGLNYPVIVGFRGMVVLTLSVKDSLPDYFSFKLLKSFFRNDGT